MEQGLAKQTMDEYSLIEKGKACASAHFVSLLNLTEEDLQGLTARMHALRPIVTEAMPTLTDSGRRIVDNYSILTAATELVGRFFETRLAKLPRMFL